LSRTPLRIGILGGTLDPVHHGHLFAAEEVRATYGLDRVLFIPCGHAPHKDERRIAPAEHRYEMCALATGSNPGFAVSRVEIDRPGPSYTIDTLRELRTIRGGDTELFLIIGADALLEIDTWHQPDAVLTEARCLAVPRPGSELSGLASVIGKERAARVEVMDLPGLEISATDIRCRVREGRPIRYLTPDAVVAYIAENGLYTEVREP
jgi:nicotinate-nucleotide adenylyltransferase